jgi:hypothetical protein
VGGDEERGEGSVRERFNALQYVVFVVRFDSIAVPTDICVVVPKIEGEAQGLGFADIVGPVLEVRLDQCQHRIGVRERHGAICESVTGGVIHKVFGVYHDGGRAIVVSMQLGKDAGRQSGRGNVRTSLPIRTCHRTVHL